MHRQTGVGAWADMDLSFISVALQLQRLGSRMSWHGAGSDIMEVLSDLTSLRIRGEYGFGTGLDTGQLDNVVFGAE